MSDQPLTLDELVRQVNEWCVAHHLTPANGQSAEQLTTRTLRYYRTLGLLGAPGSGAKQGYGEIHRLQLLAIRVLQTQGLPLRRIQSLLYGRSESDLKEILKRGTASTPPDHALPPLQAAEDWRVVPFDDSAWLILRKGRSLTPDQVSKIQSILKFSIPMKISPALQPERTS